MKIRITYAVLILSRNGSTKRKEHKSIPKMTTQQQVEADNEKVSSEGENNVYSRERSTTSNISRFTCMTFDQKERLALQAREEIDSIRANQNGGNN